MDAREIEFDMIIGNIEDIIMGIYMPIILLNHPQSLMTTTHKDEISGDILDMLLTFTDFMAFKEMFIDYRAEKEGRGLDLSTGLVVKSLNSASASTLTSSMASQSN
uniref:ADP-ribosylation factor-like protein 2-binding protein n=1 Tax=Sinocyclocheilus grahami TaxID=75366 RepID=A0A672KYW9_SINGR